MSASSAHPPEACSVLLGLQLTIPCNVHPGAIAVLSEVLLD